MASVYFLGDPGHFQDLEAETIHCAWMAANLPGLR